MKRKLVSAIAVIGLLASSTTPANAVFGLSKCEKVKKQILSEEKVSIFLYELTRKYRDSAIKDNSATWGNLSTVISKENLGRQSDIKVFDLIIKNSTCFSTAMNANVRTYKQDTQAMIKSNLENINGIMKKSLTYIVDKRALEVLKLYSWGFTSVYDKNFLKKMNN